MVKKFLKTKRASLNLSLEGMGDAIFSLLVIVLIVGGLIVALSGSFFGDSSPDNYEATYNGFEALVKLILSNKDKPEFSKYSHAISLQKNAVIFGSRCIPQAISVDSIPEKYPECIEEGNECLCVCALTGDLSHGITSGKVHCTNENLRCSTHYYKKVKTGINPDTFSYETQDGNCVQMFGKEGIQSIGILKRDKTITLCESSSSSRNVCQSSEENALGRVFLKNVIDDYRVCLQNAGVLNMYTQDQVLTAGQKYNSASRVNTGAMVISSANAKKCAEGLWGNNLVGKTIPPGHKLKINAYGWMTLYKGNVVVKESNIFFEKGHTNNIIHSGNYNQYAYSFLEQFGNLQNADASKDQLGTVVCFMKSSNSDVYYDKGYEMWLYEGSTITLYDIGFTEHSVGEICVVGDEGEADIKLEGSGSGVGKELTVNVKASDGNCPENPQKAPEMIEIDYPGAKTKIWIPEQARCGGTFPLFVPMHGRRDSPSASKPSPQFPEYNIYLDTTNKGKQFNKIAEDLIKRGKSVPIIIAAPMDNLLVTPENNGLERWKPENFNFNDFVSKVNQRLAVHDISVSSVSVMGHSNAVCGGGLQRAVSGTEVYLLAIAEGTCEKSSYAPAIVEGSMNQNAIFVHIYNDKHGYEGDKQDSFYLVDQDPSKHKKIPSDFNYLYARKHLTLERYAFNADIDHPEMPIQLFKEILPRFFSPDNIKPYTSVVS